MNWLENTSTRESRRSEFPTLLITEVVGTFNRLGKELIPNKYWGARFGQEDGQWYIEFVTNGRNKNTFGLHKGDKVTTVHGRALWQHIGRGYFELVATDNPNEYQLVRL